MTACPCCGHDPNGGRTDRGRRIIVDENGNKATVDGVEIKLTPLMTNILDYLVKRYPETAYEEALIMNCWLPHREPQDARNVLHVTLTKLRYRLADTAALITNVWGKGYVLTYSDGA
ncbi:MAG: winged helix-turn-helix domain-containing protein [Gammaproteobacteria bacterium]